VSVPAVPDIASIGRKQVDALIKKAREWNAFIDQGAGTSASITAHETSGCRKPVPVTQRLQDSTLATAYSDEILKSLLMM
jgi:hypothetical protein